jgi:hypothetical protein
MPKMFHGCSKLKELYFSSINADKVKDMINEDIPGSCRIICKDRTFKKSKCIIL